MPGGEDGGIPGKREIILKKRDLQRGKGEGNSKEGEMVSAHFTATGEPASDSDPTD